MMTVRGRTWWRGRRARRVGLTGAIIGLVLLVAGAAVLAWPTSSGTVYDSLPSRSGSGKPQVASPEAATDQEGAPAPGLSVSPTDPRQVPGVPVGTTQRQLVRTAQLTVDVRDSTAAVRQVRTTATAAGGLIVEERASDTGAWLVLRVPADTLDRVIDDIAAIGTVTDRSSQITDSTAEVVDLDARVASQQASVTRVRALLAQATSIGDVVAIESELARREAELDSLTNRLAVLRDQVAMSTLSINLQTPTGAAPVDDDPRAAGFSDGLEAGWRGLVVLGTAVAAVIGFLLPFLPVLAVLFGVAWGVRRLARARRVPAAAGDGHGRSGPGSVGES